MQNKAVILPYCSWPLDPDPSKQPVVWGEARTEAAEGLGRFPVKYKRGMADSHFSAEYYRELVYTNVDNINLLYVALTRAEEELHIYIPNEARNRNHVGSLVAGCIAADGGACELDGMRGRCTPAEAGVVYEFGRAEGPAPQRTEAPKTEHLVLEDYATAQPALRLRLPSQRYFEEEETSLLAPRNLGILLHKAFENAATEAEILGAIGEMQANAQLSQAEAAALRGFMEKWGIDPESDESIDFSRDEREQMEREHPLSLGFTPSLTLNGAKLRTSHGCGVIFLPEQPGFCADAEPAMAHYGLDRAYGWSIRRAAFPFVTKRAPKLKSLAVTMTADEVRVPGARFRADRAGDTFAFVTNDYHIFRAGRIAGTDAACGVAATLPRSAYYDALQLNYYVREAFATGWLLLRGN